MQKKTTNLMGTNYYKSNSLHLQDEINIVTQLYLNGRKITDIARAYQLEKTKFLTISKQDLRAIRQIKLPENIYPFLTDVTSSLKPESENPTNRLLKL